MAHSTRLLKSSKSGFSLIEMSIMLAVLGLLMVTLLTSGLIGRENYQLTETEEKMERILAAIQVYYNREGHLPCPASRVEPVNTASFGLSTNCAAGAPGLVQDLLPAGGTNGVDNIRIGSVPTRTLLLPDNDMFDEWGARFTYVVVKKLATTSSDFSAYQTTLTNGVIEIKDATGTSDASSTAEVNGFVLISHGADKKGAYTKKGTVGWNCGTAGSDANLDYINCDDTDAVFLNTTIDENLEPSDANGFFPTTTRPFFYDLVRTKRTTEIVEAAQPNSGSSTSSTSGSDPTTSSPSPTGSGEGGGSGSGSSSGGPGGSANPAVAAQSCYLHRPVSVQSNFTCGIASDNRAYCWGGQSSGELGDGQTTINSNTPVEVSGGYTDWMQVNTSDQSVCGLRATGEVYCWGDNTAGKLGNGTTTDAATPTPISGGFTDWVSVSSGENHSCGLRGGRAYCWGQNTSGALGTGTTTDSTTPVQVSGSYTNWAFISAGNDVSCGIRSGRVYCWGDNSSGTLGDGTYTDSSSPVEVNGGFNDWARVWVSWDHACGIRSGQAYCWGNNNAGQLGDGSTTSSNAPVEVSGAHTNWSTLSVEKESTCGIRSGQAYCWGTRQYGRIGDGGATAGNQTTPALVSGGHTDFVSISTGWENNCAARETGEILCWGRNETGEFGNGTTTDSTAPIAAATSLSSAQCGFGANCSSSFVEANGGDRIGYALMPDGNAYIWGYNTTGVFGNGTTSNTTTPTQMGTYTDWYALSADAYNRAACGIRKNGRLYCWGNRTNNVVADGGATAGTQNTPVEAAGGYNDWVEVDVDSFHGCARRGFGQTYCWGLNSDGQLGNGTNTTINSPVEVSGNFDDWSDIGIGARNSCGIRNDGEAYCWGDNSSGQLGDGSMPTDSNIPVLVSGGISNWKWIGAEAATVCGVTQAGRAYCWGDNSSGQVGNGTTTVAPTPAEVSGAFTDWTFIRGGATNSCGIRAGVLYCWGLRDYGMVGDGGATTGNQTTPAPVSGGISDWAYINPSSENVCGSTVSGNVYCWGRNNVGQVGIGNTTQQETPIKVDGLTNSCVTESCTNVAINPNSRVISVDASACAINRDGKLYCWGLNDRGQVGDGTTTERHTPVEVSGNYTDWIAVSNDEGLTCGIRGTNGTGKLYCWGEGGAEWRTGLGVTTNFSTPQQVGTYSDWTEVTASYGGCARRATGQGYCWGPNTWGMLGDGTTTARSTPTEISGSYTDWLHVAEYGEQSCGIRGTGTSGTLYCWGHNNTGAVGDGTTTQRTTPTLVSGGFTDWAVIGADYDHVCGVRANGRGYCWGRNDFGQLGDGTFTTPRLVPTEISGAYTDWSQIMGGSTHTCGIRGAAEELYCWGRDTVGMVGNGTPTGNYNTPQAIANVTNADWSIVTSGGNMNCAMKTTGETYCWGENGSGQLGDGTTTNRVSPTQILTLEAPDATNLCASATCKINIRAMHGATMAQNYDGTAYAWGANTNGHFGDSTALASPTPTQAATTYTDWVKTEGTEATGKACGLRDNKIYCWGNRANYIGDGGAIVGNQLAPLEVAGGHTDWTDVQVGSKNACGLRSTGQLFCWGLNDLGQVGDASTTARTAPVEVSGASTDWIYIGRMNDTVCGIRGIGAAGTLYCWGDNTYGEVGNGVTGGSYSSPRAVSSAYSNWSAVGVTFSTTCGLRSNGRAYCWGYNNAGQLGDSTTINRNSPLEIAGTYTDWSYIAAGDSSSCGIRAGKLYCWGLKNYGMMGDGLAGTGNQLTPVEVSGGHTNWETVSVSKENVCAARTSGEYYCWSRNDAGQVGDGSTTQRDAPVEVSGVNGCTASAGCSNLKVRKQIIATDKTSCAIATSGKLYCWGENNAGQVGDGSTTQRTTPTEVSGGHTDWTQVSADIVTCGIRGDGNGGRAYCWGSRVDGTLGDGGATTGNQLTPVEVAGGFTDWRQVEVESSLRHVCGSRENGRAYCWGDNTFGQLGDNSTVFKNYPVELNGNSTDWLYVVAIGRSSCGIRSTNGSSGQAYCWGENANGQLGDNSTTDRHIPTLVSGGYSDWTHISGSGDFVCGLRANGRAYCWGDNTNGQLGDNTTVDKHIPTEISGAYSDWTYIDGGSTHACGIRSASDVLYCWGNNATGALGDNTTTERHIPVGIAGIGNSGWSVVATGNASSCAAKATGEVYCWGENSNGQVGDNSTTERDQPTLVAGLTAPNPNELCPLESCSPKAYISTDNTTCGINKSGSAYCWGANVYGELGNGASGTNKNTPTALSGSASDWIHISATANFACGIRVNGDGYCWGYNNNGQLGDSSTTTRTAPTAIAGGHKWSKIETQTGPTTPFSCGITTGGEARCWGNNSQGQIGDNTTAQKTSPTLVSGGFSDWIDIDAGYATACGIRSSDGTKGNIYCWGDNSAGQLGNGNTGTDRLTPVALSGEYSDWTIVSTGTHPAACGIRSVGRAYCWGQNTAGRLGDGTTTDSNIPVEISGASTHWKTIASGDHTCGINGSNLYCWGDNSFGELGDNTLVAKSTPTLVSGGYNDWEAVSVGWRTTCATRADNTSWCWGRNTEGALGDSTNTDSKVPVQVAGYTAPNGNCSASGDCVTHYPVTAGDTSCALAENNQIYCWGSNTNGQYGNGTTTDSLSPVTGGGGFTDWTWLDNNTTLSCAVRSNGDGYCWGHNDNGQLGNGTTTASTTPSLISGSHSWAMIDVEVDSGLETACGVTNSGELYCWGDNSSGKYGDGTTTEQHTPTLASGGYTDWKWVRIQGTNSACGLRGSSGYGYAYCWGDNTYGQLGDGSNTASLVPVAVSGGYDDWKTLNTNGGFAVCGVRSNGRAYCWGRNNMGQLGDNTNTNRNVPTEVNGAYTDWTDIYADNHSCGIRNSGKMYCWGQNTSGELGDNSTITTKTPGEVNGAYSDWTALAVGSSQSCGIRNGTEFYCWGSGTLGQLGNGMGADSSIPVLVNTISAPDRKNCTGTSCNSQLIGAGDNYNCSVEKDGRLYCWGTSAVGEFGNGSSVVTYTSPTAVGGSYTDWVQISAGKQTVCGRRANNHIYCWGLNNKGQIGDNSTTNRNIVTAVDGGGSDWEWIDVKDRHTCGIRSGSLYCWGQGIYGKLGDGNSADVNTLTPAQVGTNTNWQTVTTAADHTCGIRGSGGQGTAYCWGLGSSGQIGNGTTTTNNTSPLLVSGGYTDWTWIHARHNHTCGLRATGQAYCWGYNANGELGDGLTANKSTPQEVTGGYTNWTSIITRNEGTCGIRSGELYCWGKNDSSQLGNGTAVDSIVPVKVSGGWYDFSAIDMSQKSACAIRGLGTIYCWGQGTNGEMGDGTLTSKASPNLVSTISSRRKCSSTDCAVQNPFKAGTDQVTCAIDTNGKLWCWGKNDVGEIGNGTTANQYTSPTQVSGGYTDWVSVSAEGDMTCGLRETGSMYCWGKNTYGGIGDGTTVDKTVPTKVSLYSDFIKIASDSFNACGIRDNATLYCWGLNNQGAVGDGTYVDKHAPALVSGGFTDWTDVTTSWATCGIRGDGLLYCWGNNTSGMVGNGITGGTYNTPQLVSGGHTDWIKVSTTDSTTCGIRQNYRAYCWGEGSAGEIGDGSGVDRNVPTEVYGALTGWTDIVSSYRNTCGINWGKLYCWGENASGSAGNHTTTASLVPKPVAGMMTDFTNVSLSGTHACALRTNHQLYCWGSGASGALGLGSTTNSYHPEKTPGLTMKAMCDECDSVLPFASRGTFLSHDGRAYSVGANTNGRFGDGTTNNSLTPVETSLGGTDWTLIKNDNNRSCGIKAGAMYCWGNRAAYLGDGGAVTGNQTTPVAVSGGYLDWIDATPQQDSVCGLRSDGTIWCFGNNTTGIYGNGTTTSYNVPTQGGGAFTDYVKVATTDVSTCGLRKGGTLYCWGSDVNGAVGNNAGSSGNVTSPALVAGGYTDWLSIHSGTKETICAIRATGQAYCWGENNNGEAGIGSNASDVFVPTEVSGASTDWQYIVGGTDGGCGIRGRSGLGSLYCWGLRSNAMIGDDGAVIGNQNSPVQVFGNYTDWIQVSQNGTSTCGARINAKYYCWGFAAANSAGDLGTGDTNQYKTPHEVPGVTASTSANANTSSCGSGVCNYSNIDAGNSVTCGVSEDTKAYCWGNNSTGTWGNGNTTSSGIPVTAFGGTSGWKRITTELGNNALAYSCALKKNGIIQCAGDNARGQLGDGNSPTDSASPVTIAGGFTDWIELDTNFEHACAVRGTGQLYCWGRNTDGKLGDGSGLNNNVPTEVAGGYTDWYNVVAGNNQTCGLRGTGTIYCWGNNGNRTFGNGTNVSSTTPVLGGGGYTDWELLSLTLHEHVCGLRSGRAYCWGKNLTGNLGDGGTSNQPTPTEVFGSYTDWTYIEAGYEESCGIRNGGHIYCWGNRAYGIVSADGGGSVGNQLTPSLLTTAGDGWKSVSIHEYNACAINEDGYYYCWGLNDVGQAGIGTTTPVATPTKITTIQSCTP